MTAETLLNLLTSQGATLWKDGPYLRYRGPAGVLTSDRLASLASNKGSVMELLARRGPPRDLPVKPATLQHPLPGVLDPESASDINPALPETPGTPASESESVGSVAAVCTPPAPVATPAECMSVVFDEVTAVGSGTVTAMFADARARLGGRDLEERSLSVWLRQHAPEIAALWPDAPLSASWFDWRRHVQAEHVAALDSAYAAVFSQAKVAGLSRPAPKGDPAETTLGANDERI